MGLSRDTLPGRAGSSVLLFVCNATGVAKIYVGQTENWTG